MSMYQNYEPMVMTEESSPATANQMRCAGCGGKISGSVLSRVLDRLDIPASEHVLLGLDQPDDAAIVQPPGGRPLTVTVDFFAAPVDDPYLAGRFAALNSASDLFAMGSGCTESRLFFRRETCSRLRFNSTISHRRATSSETLSACRYAINMRVLSR